MSGFQPKAEMPKLTTPHISQNRNSASQLSYGTSLADPQKPEQLTDNTATGRWSERWQEW
jgi:hypothetical protein